MYDVMVFDHRLAEHRQLDSKSELTRLLFGYTTGNGQKFPAQAELVIFTPRPGAETFSLEEGGPFDGIRAVELVRDTGQPVRFTYRAEGRRTEGILKRIGGRKLRVV